MNIYYDKVAIITGAGSDIGKGLAEELARRGAHLVISNINSERIEKTEVWITIMDRKSDQLGDDMKARMLKPENVHKAIVLVVRLTKTVCINEMISSSTGT